MDETIKRAINESGSMSAIIGSGVVYFGIVFLVGFVLGAVRTFVIAPRLGATPAVLLEAPIILAVSWFVAIWCVGRFMVPAAPLARLTMGRRGVHLAYDRRTRRVIDRLPSIRRSTSRRLRLGCRHHRSRSSDRLRLDSRGANLAELERACDGPGRSHNSGFGSGGNITLSVTNSSPWPSRRGTPLPFKRRTLPVFDPFGTVRTTGPLGVGALISAPSTASVSVIGRSR